MYYSVFLASYHPFPSIPFVQEQRACNAERLKDDHPVKKWLTKSNLARLGSRTRCACGLNFHSNEWVERNETPPFPPRFTAAMWAAEQQEYVLDKKCLEDYYTYMRHMLVLDDLEWYCWDGDWDIPPVSRLQLSASVLTGEPDFRKDHSLTEGLFIYYQAAF